MGARDACCDRTDLSNRKMFAGADPVYLDVQKKEAQQDTPCYLIFSISS